MNQKIKNNTKEGNKKQHTIKIQVVGLPKTKDLVDV
jgi:hypothetical protein